MLLWRCHVAINHLADSRLPRLYHIHAQLTSPIASQRVRSVAVTEAERFHLSYPRQLKTKEQLSHLKRCALRDAERNDIPLQTTAWGGVDTEFLGYIDATTK